MARRKEQEVSRVHIESERSPNRPGPWVECSLGPVDYTQVLHVLEHKKKSPALRGGQGPVSLNPLDRMIV